MLTAKQRRKIFTSDPRIVSICEYPEGFLPNAYKWRAPGTRYVSRIVDGRLKRTTQSYDRKRSGGRGPTWTALSERSGVILSG